MNYTFRPCSEVDLEAMVAMETEAIAHLERSDLLRHNGREMLSRCLQPPHWTIGAYDELGEMAAFAVLFVPEAGTGEDLSRYLEKAESGLRSANYKLCIVRPQYRGQHLMQALGERIIEEAKHRGIERLCSTVSPYNPASFLTLQALGFEKNTSFQHYNGNLLRDLYYKTI